MTLHIPTSRGYLTSYAALKLGLFDSNWKEIAIAKSNDWGWVLRFLLPDFCSSSYFLVKCCIYQAAFGIFSTNLKNVTTNHLFYFTRPVKKTRGVLMTFACGSKPHCNVYKNLGFMFGSCHFRNFVFSYFGHFSCVIFFKNLFPF